MTSWPGSYSADRPDDHQEGDQVVSQQGVYDVQQASQVVDKQDVQ
jgi:hypothetical protein